MIPMTPMPMVVHVPDPTVSIPWMSNGIGVIGVINHPMFPCPTAGTR